jgi:hypothetical protein
MEQPSSCWVSLHARTMPGEMHGATRLVDLPTLQGLPETVRIHTINKNSQGFHTQKFHQTGLLA